MNTPSSSSLVVRTLYRNLLRATKPFTINPSSSSSSSSSEARVLNCLLHRTGSDDLISDWDGFVASNPKDDIEPQDQARDLTYSYGSKQSQQQHQSPHHQEQQQSDIPSHRTQERLFRRLLREAVAGDNYGVRKLRIPSEIEENDTRRLREIIRREFRCKSDDGSDISSLSATTTSDAASVHFDIETRKQVAFTALRELNKKLSYYDQLQTTSPEPVPEQAAFNVTRLEVEPSSNYLKPGTFLIAHPHMADTWFDKAVICILEHKPDDDDGRKKRGGAGRQRRRRSFTGDVKTLGIVVNRTSINHETGENRTLKDAFEQNSIPGRLSNIFGNSMVREGGPVLHTGLQMLHSAPSSGGDEDEDDQDENVAMIGGTLVPSIPPDGDDSSSALYSDRATYFNGDTFQAASAIEEGSVDRGMLYIVFVVVAVLSKIAFQRLGLLITYLSPKPNLLPFSSCHH